MEHNNVIKENQFSFNILEQFHSADGLRAYLKLYYSSLAGKLAVARASQIKIKFNILKNECTPYEFLNAKIRMKNFEFNLHSNIKINTLEYIKTVVYHAPLFGIRYYILAKMHEDHAPDFIKQRIDIFNYILFLINENKNLDHVEFITIFRSKMNMIEVPKGRISSEFYDLVHAFKLLSAEEIIRHYNEYTEWLNHLEAYLSSTLTYTLKFEMSKLTNDDYTHIIESKTEGIFLVDLRKSLDHLKLYPGCRLSMLDGDVTVIGLDCITKDKLWVQLDHDLNLASYYIVRTVDDLKKLMKQSNLLQDRKLTREAIKAHIYENGISHISFDVKINDQTINKVILDISQNSFAQFDVNFLDCIQSVDGREVIIGIYQDKLVTLHENFSHYAYLKNNSRAYEIIKTELFVHQGIANIINKIYRHTSADLFKYYNSQANSQFEVNIFHQINYYLNKMFDKTRNESEKHLHERMVIVNSIYDHFQKTINSNEDYSKILKNHIIATDVPKGVFSKRFYRLIYSLTERPYHHLKNDYLQYSHQVNQNIDFLIYINKLLINLFKILQSRGAKLSVLRNNGALINLNTSHEALNKFGCLLFSRVKTSCIEGTIIGIDGKNIIILPDKGALCAAKSVSHFISITPPENETLNLNLNKINLPENIQSIFFPYKLSNVEQNEFFSISNDTLMMYQAYFSQRVISNEGYGFILGMHHNNIIVYWDSLNQSENIVLKSYNKSDYYVLQFMGKDFNNDNINMLIKFLLKLGQQIYRTTLIAEEKILFSLDIPNEIEQNKFKIFNVFKMKGNKKLHADEDNNQDNYHSSIYPL